MRIKLDYYRILGLTPQATSEQINQAHRDRVQSLPRREYSDLAIASRKKLLAVANSVLADPSQRQIYDAQILPSLANTEQDFTFSIDIDQRELAGALLVLYELGEYMQILQLTNQNSDQNSNLDKSIDPDIILSIALSYLELGRESWKQAKYETTFGYFEAGRVLLINASLFTDIRLEIESSLWQLRPYRILELIAHPEDQISQRQQGIALLKEMLDQRRGIDGRGDDHSNLDIDKFLQFILQIRAYMTSYEQQLLFEDEARRPCLVASYLAVHALIARGFSQGQPALIRRAKSLLAKIGSDRDVYLEQAIGSMLLGQLEEAMRILVLSTEEDKLALIQELSDGEPDLVTGLYIYTQQWLQDEIYPNFRDLVGETVDLQPYFGNEHVQTYIEELPNTSLIPSEWISPPFANYSGYDDHSQREVLQEIPKETPRQPQEVTKSSPRVEFERDFSIYPVSNGVQPPVDYSRSPVAKREARKEKRRSSPTNRRQKHQEKNQRHHPTTVKPKSQVGRLVLWGIISLVVAGGAMAVGFWGSQALRHSNPDQQLVLLERPLLPLIETSIKNSNFPDPVAPSGEIDQKKAQEIVTTWQTVKTKALGNTYQIQELDQILAEPALADWRSRADIYKKHNEYLEYLPKSLEFKEFHKLDENKAYAIAQISETRNLYKNGQLDQASSVEDSYKAKYILVKKDNKWLIQSMAVLK